MSFQPVLTNGGTFPDRYLGKLPHNKAVAPPICDIPEAALVCRAVTGMKIVLRHNLTGRYYNGHGQWVRRADNAAAFDDVCAAAEYARKHHLRDIRPVRRLAPYMKELLNVMECRFPGEWSREKATAWCLTRARRFSHN